MRYIFTVFILVIFALHAIAQQPEGGRVWTLRDCIDYALKNNLTVKRSEYSVQSSQINAFQAKMAMLPTLNGSGNYGFNWGRNIDISTNQFVDNQRIKSINLSLQASLLLWNGFRLFYNTKQTESDRDATDYDFIKAKNDVILNVINLYLNTIFNKELVAVAEYQLQSTNEQLDRTRKLSEAGSVPVSEVLNLEAQQATNELNLIQQENAYNLTLLQLKQALQLPASTEMLVEVPQLNLQNQFVLDKTAEEIFDIATLSMPEIKSSRQRQQSSLFALKSARGNYYPRLSLSAGISTIYSDRSKDFIQEGPPTILNTTQVIGFVNGTDPVTAAQYINDGYIRTTPLSTQFDDNLGKSLSFNLSIPIFNGYASRAGVQRAKISMNLADITYKETENQLRQAVETAYNDAYAASKTYNSSLKQVDARDEAFRMTKQRYELGAVNFVEYQVAENTLFQAQSDLLRAKYNFIFRKKVLDFYQGLPLEF